MFNVPIGCAGDVGAAADFVCRLDCKRGLAEVSGLASGVSMPPAGIFDPPYAINAGLTQLPIITKVQDVCPRLLNCFLEMHTFQLHCSSWCDK